ncbi:hypothetical protein GS870_25285 [Rhodococcus hoagii]|nr:hypothetical protein [Prescottella equi]
MPVVGAHLLDTQRVGLSRNEVEQFSATRHSTGPGIDRTASGVLDVGTEVAEDRARDERSVRGRALDLEADVAVLPVLETEMLADGEGLPRTGHADLVDGNREANLKIPRSPPFVASQSIWTSSPGTTAADAVAGVATATAAAIPNATTSERPVLEPDPPHADLLPVESLDGPRS